MLNVSIWERRARSTLIEGYATWVADLMSHGWDGYLATLMFDDLPGSLESQIAQMHLGATGMFRRLMTRMVRKPRSPEWSPLLPKGVFAPDLPVSKRRATELFRDPPANDGLHLHGIILASRAGRLTDGLDLHFQQKRAIYLTGRLRTIDVQRIDRNPEYATEYALKGLKRPCFGPDHLLVLPRTIDEISQYKQYNTRSHRSMEICL